MIDSATLSPRPARGNCFSGACPGRTILSHVAGRWGSLVIAALRSAEALRFSQLRVRIEGVSEKMLAQTLRELERDGLV
ncbi:MAG: helix-turn-helix transcriptional regulator, partial [Candidatus Eremiobacteraeota bacterium]|nr:helix-turn-helix transcriptional regulator [Candidatus Eremiobacteraeota bacterium]